MELVIVLAWGLVAILINEARYKRTYKPPPDYRINVRERHRP